MCACVSVCMCECVNVPFLWTPSLVPVCARVYLCGQTIRLKVTLLLPRDII